MLFHSAKALALAAIFSSGVVTSSVLRFDGSIQERQAGFQAVTGARVGGIQPRLELRTLQAQPQAWNLFLLAWARFQAMSQSETTSYYQIAGMSVMVWL